MPASRRAHDRGSKCWSVSRRHTAQSVAEEVYPVEICESELSRNDYSWPGLLVLEGWKRLAVPYQEVWRSGALEASCGPGDVQGQRYGYLELGRNAAGRETWRCLPQELCSGPGDVEV